MSWFFYVGRFLSRVIFRTMTCWRVKGSENVPKEGAFLIVANHLNNADPPLIGSSIKRPIMFMAKEELFRPAFIGYFIRGFGAFPVRRGQIDRKAIRQAHKILESGLGLTMFPEGSRSRDARLQPAFPGSALIAAHMGVSILPIGITGTEKIKGFSWIFRRPHILCNIGVPFQLPRLSGEALTKDKLIEYTEDIMIRIAELLPSDYRGCYADKVKQ